MTGNIVTIYGCLSANDRQKRSEPITYEQIYRNDEIRRIADEKKSKQDMHDTLLRIRKLAEKLEEELQYYKTLSGVDTDSMMKSLRGLQRVALDEMDRLAISDDSAYKHN